MGAEWILRLGHACVGGSLFILGVGLACRLAPRLPARLRAWLWWLACLKLVLDLCWAAPIVLPVLPIPTARIVSAPALSPAAPTAAAYVSSGAVPDTKGDMPPEEGRHSQALPTRPPHVPWQTGLVAFWLTGVLLSLASTLRQGVRLTRTVRAASDAPIRDADVSAIAATLGLRRASRILQHPTVSAPCVTGWVHPAILLPPGLTQTLTNAELRLTLAHEMAHIRHGDLRLALLPALARALFFFHPLVWWASTEWGTANEEACDALTLRVTGASTAEYGHLLLRMASGETRPPALGLSPGFHTLRRRLLGLAQSGRESRRARWLLALALPLLLPWRLTAAVRAAPASPSFPGTTPARYQITDLGNIGGGAITDLNDAGQIAGTVLGSNDRAHGFFWDAGRPLPLGALPKHHASIAYGVNGRGQVVGASYNIPGRGRAFLWDGSPHRIGSLPGFPYSEAHGVNDASQVVGSAETGDSDRWQARIARAFLWNGGEMADLGTLGGLYSHAYGLNNAGVVVGKADTSVFGQTHAFAWSDGQMQDLGTLGGANSLAYRINDRGQVVGYSETGPGATRHAFLTTDGSMRDLGTLPGLENSIAYDINGAGEAVGAAAPAPDAPGTRALLWRNGQTIDLNRLLPPASGWALDEARAINDRGQITGLGHFHGSPHAFLLTPQ